MIDPDPEIKSLGSDVESLYGSTDGSLESNVPDVPEGKGSDQEYGLDFKHPEVSMSQEVCITVCSDDSKSPRSPSRDRSFDKSHKRKDRPQNERVYSDDESLENYVGDDDDDDDDDDDESFVPVEDTDDLTSCDLHPTTEPRKFTPLRRIRKIVDKGPFVT